MTTVGVNLLLFALGVSCLNVCKGISADTILTFLGKIVNNDENEETLMLICIANKKPFLCSIEFLHNNSTVESLRNSEGGCYDKYGPCQPRICSCSENCTSFQWNLTTSSLQINDSLSCQTRIYNSTYKSFHKVYALVVYNGTDFTSMTSVTWPVPKISDSPSKEKKPVGDVAVEFITVVAIGLVVLCVILVDMACKHR